MNVITPRISHDSEVRMTINVTEGDVEAVKAMGRREGWTLVVTDVPSRRRYLIGGAECSSPGCNCDAVLLKELMDS